MLKQKQQENDTGYSENADDESIYQIDRNRNTEYIAEKVNDKKTDKAEKRIEQQLENKTYRFPENFDEQQDGRCGNPYDKYS